MFSVNLLYTPNLSYKDAIKPYLDKQVKSKLIQVFTHRCDKGFIESLV